MITRLTALKADLQRETNRLKKLDKLTERHPKLKQDRQLMMTIQGIEKQYNRLRLTSNGKVRTLKIGASIRKQPLNSWTLARSASHSVMHNSLSTQVYHLIEYPELLNHYKLT